MFLFKNASRIGFFLFFLFLSSLEILRSDDGMSQGDIDISSESLQLKSPSLDCLFFHVLLCLPLLISGRFPLLRRCRLVKHRHIQS